MARITRYSRRTWKWKSKPKLKIISIIIIATTISLAATATATATTSTNTMIYHRLSFVSASHGRHSRFGRGSTRFAGIVVVDRLWLREKKDDGKSYSLKIISIIIIATTISLAATATATATTSTNTMIYHRLSFVSASHGRHSRFGRGSTRFAGIVVVDRLWLSREER